MYKHGQYLHKATISGKNATIEILDTTLTLVVGVVDRIRVFDVQSRVKNFDELNTNIIYNHAHFITLNSPTSDCTPINSCLQRIKSL